MAPPNKKNKGNRRTAARKGNTNLINPKFEVFGQNCRTIECKKETTLREEGIWEEFLLFKRDKEAKVDSIANDKKVKAGVKKAKRAAEIVAVRSIVAFCR